MVQDDPAVEGERAVDPSVGRTPRYSVDAVFVLVDRPHLHIWWIVGASGLVLRSQPRRRTATNRYIFELEMDYEKIGGSRWRVT